MLTSDGDSDCRERTIANLSQLSQLKPLIQGGVPGDVLSFVLSFSLPCKASLGVVC